MNDEGVMQTKPSGGAKPPEELCEGHAAHGRSLSAPAARAIREDSGSSRERITNRRNGVARHFGFAHAGIYLAIPTISALISTLSLTGPEQSP